jgi:hypothetical protein
VEQRNQARGWHQYFEGFRVNCESIPRLPAAAVRFAIDDPRQIPYLFVWTWMGASEIKEAVSVVWERQDDWIEVKRSDRSAQRISDVLLTAPETRWTGAAALLSDVRRSSSPSLRLECLFWWRGSFALAMPNLCWSPLQVRRHLHCSSLASAGRLSTHSTLGPLPFH